MHEVHVGDFTLGPVHHGDGEAVGPSLWRDKLPSSCVVSAAYVFQDFSPEYYRVSGKCLAVIDSHLEVHVCSKH